MTPLLLMSGVCLIGAGAQLLRHRPAWHRLLATGYARVGGRRAARKVRADRLARPAAGAALVVAGVACLVAGLL